MCVRLRNSCKYPKSISLQLQPTLLLQSLGDRSPIQARTHRNVVQSLQHAFFHALQTADIKMRLRVLQQATSLLLQGEPHTAKLLLRDLVNASIGFEQLARDIDKPPKSLHRMLSAAGNPTLSHVSAMLAAIAAHLGVEIEAKVKLT